MTKILKITVTTIERWKRYAARGDCRLLFQELEAFRRHGGEEP